MITEFAPYPRHIGLLRRVLCSIAPPLGPFGSIKRIYPHAKATVARIPCCTVVLAVRAISNMRFKTRASGAAGPRSARALRSARRPTRPSWNNVKKTPKRNVASAAKTVPVTWPIAVSQAQQALVLAVRSPFWTPIRATEIAAWAHAHATSTPAHSTLISNTYMYWRDLIASGYAHPTPLREDFSHG